MKWMLPFFLATLLVTPALADEEMHVHPAPQAPGLEQLKSLVGKWKATGKEHEGMTVEFSETAGGTALVEAMTMADGGTMTTVYHSDGENLMLTHYCHVGNQPRMRGRIDGKAIKFAFVDATNMASPDAPHMHDLILTIAGKDKITEEWTYMEAGKSQPMLIELTRAN